NQTCQVDFSRHFCPLNVLVFLLSSSQYKK
ncbi:MAG: hypothetical protein ACI892_002004, partial [Marinobacter maritimus]